MTRYELVDGKDDLRFSILGLAPDPVDGREGIEASTFVTGTVADKVASVVIECRG